MCDSVLPRAFWRPFVSLASKLNPWFHGSKCLLLTHPLVEMSAEEDRPTENPAVPLDRSMVKDVLLDKIPAF